MLTVWNGNFQGAGLKAYTLRLKKYKENFLTNLYRTRYAHSLCLKVDLAFDDAVREVIGEAEWKPFWRLNVHCGDHRT